MFEDWQDLDVYDDGTVRHSTGIDFASTTESGVFAEVKTTASKSLTFLEDSLQRSARAVFNQKIGNDLPNARLEFYIYWYQKEVEEEGDADREPNFADLAQKESDLEDDLDIEIEIMSQPMPFNPY